MTLKRCQCGGSAAIRTEKNGRIYATRVICESCGRRSKPALDTSEPGPAVERWAKMYWNCGLYEQEVKRA